MGLLTVARLAAFSLAGVLSAVGALGCGPAPLPSNVWGSLAEKRGASSVPREAPEVSQAEWSVSRDRLARVRAELPSRAYVERVQVALVDPRSRVRYEARGAVAVDPNRALRMMLVGPGGTTAIDLWVTKDRFRFAMPALKIEKRGGRGAEEARGLPVGFFRWWFLSPVGGTLLFARSSKAESAWLLRDGEATVSMRTDGERFFAFRREGERLEGMEWLGRGLGPKSGARGRYIDGSHGLRVEVIVEDVLAAPPDPAAFDDPDGEGEGSSNADASRPQEPTDASEHEAPRVPGGGTSL